MIAHIDADAFFASVEQAADPRLRGRPVAVGGSRRGIIASASYEARRHGIHTPMPTSRALRICPHLVLLPGDYERYERFSQFMFSYAYDFTPLVEIGSIDEGYLDLAGNRDTPPFTVATTIRETIARTLKIGVSQGIGTSKLVAQIASKLRKPRALIHVLPGDELDFLHPLDAKWLPGVGPVTEQILRRAGLASIHHVARTPLPWLRILLGDAAPALQQFARGIDPRPVTPTDTARDAQSYGHQETFDQDTADERLLHSTLRSLVDRATDRLRADRRSARTISIKIRYADMAETERSSSTEEPCDLPEDFYDIGWRLLKRAWDRRVRLRMLRVKLAGIYRSPAQPPLLDADLHRKRRALHAALTEIRQRYGPRAARRGHEMELRS